MRQWFQDVDSLLRGGYTASSELSEGRLRVRVSKLALIGLSLGAIYGVFMGSYGVLRPGSPSFAQLAATTFKVPLLFLLTLAVTLPSLYVFSALDGSRLRLHDTLKMLLAATAVNLALLASLGPITGFFTLSTESYPFMVVLNVLLFGLAGLVALAFLHRMLNHVFVAPPPTAAPGGAPPESAEQQPEEQEQEPVPEPPPFVEVEREAPQSPPDGPRAQEFLRAVAPTVRHRRIFTVWTVIYGVIGAQMGWILRPFIGMPNQPFTLFRQRESNFFQAFFEALGRLFS